MASYNTKQEKNKGGRPTEYKEDMPDRAYRLCLLGLKDVELCDAFGISEQTLSTWKKKYPKFLESINEGKIKADAYVAESMYNRAKGYTYIEKEVYTDKEGIKTTKVSHKHSPAEVRAGKYWLNNRQRGIWTDTTKTEITGKDGKPIEHINRNPISQKQLAQLTDEELGLAIKLGILQNADNDEDQE